MRGSRAAAVITSVRKNRYAGFGLLVLVPRDSIGIGVFGVVIAGMSWCSATQKRRSPWA